MKKCKRCGCDFPYPEIYEHGCINCETKEEMSERHRKWLLAKLTKEEKDNDLD